MDEKVSIEQYELRLQAWLKALRSDRFYQGQLRLCLLDDPEDPSIRSYCCLGVACDTYSTLTGIGQWVMSEDEMSYEFRGKRSKHTTILPEEVQEYFGLRGAMGGIDRNNIQLNPLYLTELNDDEDYSFDQIADFIENNKKGLFVWA